MKVALVASSFLPEHGRLERRVDELARGLADRGAEVEILAQGQAHRTPEQGDRVTIRRFPSVVGPLRFGVAPKLRERLRMTSQEFDIVDVHTRQAALALAVASARVQRLVLTPGVPIDVFLGWPHTGATRALIAAAAQIVCRSKIERDLLCETVPRAARRVTVVPDGFDAVALRTAEPFESTGVVVLSVDRLDRATSVGRAIAAMPSLDPEFRLVVVGDGPARGRLSAFADDLRISSRVQFVGAVSDAFLYRWLRTARVVVTVPIERSSGALLTEARAARVSVVASDLPVHRQAADQPGLGHVIFVPPRGSPLDVADAIDEAARLPTRSDAALLASTAPSWESVIDSTWKLYRQLIDGFDHAEDGAGGEVVDFAAQFDAAREIRVEPVMPGNAQAGNEPANGRPRWQTRHRLEDRVNGARRWP